MDTSFTDNTDEDFIRSSYQALLNREADPSGLENFKKAMANGMTRRAVVRDIADSTEFWTNKLKSTFSRSYLPNLAADNPERYRRVKYVGSEETSLVYHASCPEDWDWIERKIIECGYYDTIGSWPLSQSPDFQTIADQIKVVGGKSVLDMGCATGQVIEHLKRDGWYTIGVEISHLAIAFAPKSIRDNIRYGDVLDMQFDRQFDVVMGMDIFEHLNANKLDRYIEKLSSLVSPGGHLVTNIPTFGADQVFGEVFKVYLQPWTESEDGMFRDVEVDALGWPNGGHIILAKSDWWQRQFEKHGLERKTYIERRLQDRFSEYFISAPARKSTFIFRKL